LQLLPEALVFNIHALHGSLRLAADSHSGPCVANAEMIASPVEIKLTHYPGDVSLDKPFDFIEGHAL
jgi:hypothetical protein